jgi:aminoglycoside phosphotransferase (APT) family kinase protein
VDRAGLVRRRPPVRPAAVAEGLGQLVVAAAERLRASVEAGDFDGLDELYAPDAVLDAALVGARRRLRGPEQIATALAGVFPGPGRLIEWDEAAHPDGVAVWLERVGDDGGAVRQRHYLHLGADGRVGRHWVYTARPRTAPAADPVPEAAEDVFASLGPAVERTTLASSGWSGNRIDRLVLADGAVLIAKRIVPGSDWLGRCTRDPGREARLFADGVFARMPAGVDPAVVAAEPDGDAWWVVMRDVSADLLDDSTPLTREQNRFVLTRAAEMWVEFWDEQVPHLATLHDRLAFAVPAISETERDDVDILPKQFEAAWEAFGEAVEDDVADAILGLLDDVTPLSDALAARGTTLVHGDLRDENIAFTDDGRLVLLDFGLASQAHPAAELAWYMVHDVWRIDATHDEVVEDFRRALGERDDPVALELGLISGLVQYGWIFGHSAVVHTDPAEREWANTELNWWVPRVRHALEQWR